MQKPVVTFDTDGVFANYTKIFTDLVNAACGTQYSEHWPCYDVSKAYFERDHFTSGLLSTKGTEYFWLRIPAYPDVPWKKINSMMFEGLFHGYAISLRDSKFMGQDAPYQTRLWLREHGLTELQGVIVGLHDRVALLKMLGSDFHLDDCGEHVERLRAVGINAWLLDRPWNQDAKVDQRVNSINQFLEVIAPSLPVEAQKHYFSPPSVADIMDPNASMQRIAQSIIGTQFRFSELAEAR